MKKYIVKKGNVGGFGGRTFKIGDEVCENDFPKGNAKDLEKMNILEEVKEKKQPSRKPKQPVQKEEK